MRYCNHQQNENNKAVGIDNIPAEILQNLEERAFCCTDKAVPGHTCIQHWNMAEGLLTVHFDSTEEEDKCSEL